MRHCELIRCYCSQLKAVPFSRFTRHVSVNEDILTLFELIDQKKIQQDDVELDQDIAVFIESKKIKSRKMYFRRHVELDPTHCCICKT